MFCWTHKLDIRVSQRMNPDGSYPLTFTLTFMVLSDKTYWMDPVTESVRSHRGCAAWWFSFMHFNQSSNPFTVQFGKKCQSHILHPVFYLLRPKLPWNYSDEDNCSYYHQQIIHVPVEPGVGMHTFCEGRFPRARNFKIQMSADCRRSSLKKGMFESKTVLHELVFTPPML